MLPVPYINLKVFIFLIFICGMLPREIFSQNTYEAGKSNIHFLVSTKESDGSNDGGGGSVNEFTGTFSNAYSIDLPPGNGLVTPSLAISYNSMKANGNCGVGWSLDIPFIERQGKDNSMPTFNDTEDKFVLHIGGAQNELIKNSDGTYSTEYENFLKIEKISFGEIKIRIGSPYGYDIWVEHYGWKITDLNGNILTFGNPYNNSSFGYRYFFSRWYLNAIEDLNGNQAVYNYNKINSSPYISSIYWGRNIKIDTLSNAFQIGIDHYKYSIDFEYQPRSDSVFSYKDGVGIPFTIGGKLKNIYVKNKGHVLWSYNLNYKLSSFSKRSLLTSIEKKSPNGQKFSPETKFTYFEDKDSYISQSKLFNTTKNLVFLSKSNDTVPNPTFVTTRKINGLYTQYDSGVRILDVNGDALPDFLVACATYNDVRNSPVSIKQKVFINLGIINDAVVLKESVNCQLPPDVIFVNNYPVDIPDGGNSWIGSDDNGFRFGDLNGDGLQDIIQLVQKGSITYKKEIIDGRSVIVKQKNFDPPITKIYLGNKKGGWNEVSWQIPSGLFGGYPLIFNYSWKDYYLYNPRYYKTIKGVDMGLRLLDINLDGKDDLILNRLNSGGGHIKHVFINNGNGSWSQNDTTYSIPVPFTEIVNRNDNFSTDKLGIPPIIVSTPHRNKDWGVRLGELNGDGLVDIVQAYNLNENKYTITQKVFFNNGKGWNENSETNWFPDKWKSEAFTIIQEKENRKRVDHLSLRLVDVNGDGLSDLVRKNSEDVYYNFNSATDNCGVALSNGCEFNDLNETLFNHDIESIALTIQQQEQDFVWNTGIQIADIDGNGTVDLLKSVDGKVLPDTKSDNNIFYSGGVVTDILKRIESPSGLITEIEYIPSTKHDSTKIPFVLQTVKSIKNKALGETYPQKQYYYLGGKWDGNKRKFLGFEAVSSSTMNNTETDHLGTKKTWFHQDSIKNGKPFKTEVRNKRGQLIGRTRLIYQEDKDGKAPYFTPVIEKIEELYEGNPNPLSKKTTYEYKTGTKNGQPFRIREYDIENSFFALANEPDSQGNYTIGRTYNNHIILNIENPASNPITSVKSFHVPPGMTCTASIKPESVLIKMNGSPTQAGIFDITILTGNASHQDIHQASLAVRKPNEVLVDNISDRIQEIKYAYENIDVMLNKNKLMDVYETTVKDSDGNLLSQSRTEYGQDALPYQSMTWDQDRKSWIKGAQITKRDLYGKPVETIDIDGNKSTTIYGHNGLIALGSVQNAGYDEVVIEDFNDNSYSDGEPYAWASDQGASIQDGELKCNFIDAEKYFYITKQLPQDNFIVEFDVKINQARYEHDWVGFNFRKVTPQSDFGSSNGGMIYLRKNGQLDLYRINPSGIEKTVNINSSTLEWNRIKLVAQGSLISVFVNGQKLFSYTSENGTKPGEFLSFVGNYCNFELDNIRIYPAEAYCASSSYDPVTMLKTMDIDADGVRSFYYYDDTHFLTKTEDDDGKTISEHERYFSRSSGSYSHSRPNYSRTKTHNSGKTTVSTTYMDAGGRTLQTQVQDGSYDYVTTNEFDSFGRPNKAWATYKANTGHAFHNTIPISLSDGYTHTEYYNDPMSRVKKTTPIQEHVELPIQNEFGYSPWRNIKVSYPLYLKRNGHYSNVVLFETDMQPINGDYSVIFSNLPDGLTYNYDTFGQYWDGDDRIYKVRVVLNGSPTQTGIFQLKIRLEDDYSENINLKIAVKNEEFDESTEYEYGIEGNRIVKTVKSPFKTTGDKTISKTYTDIHGRTIKSVVAVGAPEQITSSTKYDILGRAIETTDPMGYKSTTNYNFLGQTVSMKSVDVTGSTQFIYDRAGRIRFSQNAEQRNQGVYAYFKYDREGLLIEEGYTSGSWSGLQSKADNEPAFPETPATWRKKYTYDKAGTENNRKGKVWMILTNNDNLNDAEIGEQFEYDKYGDILKTHLIVYDYDSNTRTIVYAYDDAGNITQITYPNGEIVTYSYNHLGELTQVGKPGDSDFYASYTYNSRGGMSTETIMNGNNTITTRQFTYDKKGRLTKIHDKVMLQTLNYTANGYSGDGYLNGNIAATTFSYIGGDAPEAYSYKYRYNRLGFISAFDNTLNRNWDVDNIEYDKNGNLKRVYADQVIDHQYTYLPSSNKVDQVNLGGSAYQKYRHNANGAVVQSKPSQGITQDYTYDLFMARTTNAQVGSQNVELQYNSSDERVLKKANNGALKTLYLHGLSDFPLLTYTNSGEPTAYIYGPTGLLAIKSDLSLIGNDLLPQNNEYQSSYPQRRNINASYPLYLDQGEDYQDVFLLSADILEFDHPVPNLMSVYNLPPGITANINDGRVYLNGTPSKAGIFDIKFYINDEIGWDDFKLKIAVRGKTNELTYVLKDHLGSSKILVDASGTIKAGYDYTPFGEYMRETGTWDTRYQFTGQEFDNETNLYNYRARLYDPVLKRFLDTDPAGQGFSPYAYAGNNPVYFVDPTGQFIDIGFLLFSAISSGFMSASTADFYGGSFFGGFMKGFTIGAFTSLAGQAASAGVYSLFDPTANQLIAGAASGAAGGFASGATNALMTGGNSLKSGLISGGIGGALGGITGGFKNQARGMNFWDGQPSLDDALAYQYILDRGSGNIFMSTDIGGHSNHMISIADKVIDEHGLAWYYVLKYIYREGSSIEMFRFWESASSTISAFVLTSTGFTGNMLEPKGPSTTIRNQNQRVPAGSYNLTTTPVDGDYPGHYKIYNSEVPADRGITIHSGNIPVHTEGCLLPGPSWSPNRVGASSKTMVRELNKQIKFIGHRNIKLNYNHVSTYGW